MDMEFLDSKQLQGGSNDYYRSPHAAHAAI